LKTGLRRRHRPVGRMGGLLGAQFLPRQVVVQTLAVTGSATIVVELARRSKARGRGPQCLFVPVIGVMAAIGLVVFHRSVVTVVRPAFSNSAVLMYCRVTVRLHIPIVVHRLIWRTTLFRASDRGGRRSCEQTRQGRVGVGGATGRMALVVNPWHRIGSGAMTAYGDRWH